MVRFRFSSQDPAAKRAMDMAMSGAWSGSTRSASLPPDWRQIVNAVHRRSGGRCEWKVNPAAGNYRRCPNPADGGVDHYKGRDNHALDSLRDSCKTHHNAKSSAEGTAAKAAKKALRNRPKEAHPGFVSKVQH